MSKRTITVELTDVQFDAIMDALTRGQYDIECELDDGPDRGRMKRRWMAGERGITTFVAAWHAAGRPS